MRYKIKVYIRVNYSKLRNKTERMLKMRMSLRVKITGYVYITIPEELEHKSVKEIWEELQDEISNIDCGELQTISCEAPLLTKN